MPLIKPKRKIVIRVVLCVLAILVLGFFGYKTPVSFCPETLQVSNERVIAIPWLGLPIFWYGSEDTTPLIDLLVKKGYWKPNKEKEPEWISIASGDPFVRGGTRRMYFVLHGTFWVKWTNDHPELAREFWPHVLKLMRSGDYPDVRQAGRMLSEARMYISSGDDSIMELVEKYSE